MKQEKRLWNWYRNHHNVINAVVGIACDVTPGGAMAKNVLMIPKGEDDNEAWEGKQAQAQKLLAKIRPDLLDLVEDIETLKRYHKELPVEDVKVLIETSALKPEVDRVALVIGQCILESLPPTVPAPISLSPIPHRLNDYVLEAVIGRGGQGEVFRSMHPCARIPVAIKRLPLALGQDPAALQQIRTEYGRLVEHLTHPHIVAYRDLGQDKATGQWFVVMDYVAGQNLREWLTARCNRPVALDKALVMLGGVAEALDHAHHHEIIHCDLKPENILLRNQDQFVFLTDFGIASKVRETLTVHIPTSEIQLKGTLPYMAPEQYCGRRPEAQTDIWALGVILYELLAGHRPFSGVNLNHYMKVVCEIPPEPIADLPAGVWAVLAGMLVKDKQQRPSSAREALQALSQARAKAQRRQMVNVRKTTPKASPKHISWGVSLGVVLAVLVSVGTGAYWLRPVSVSEPPSELADEQPPQPHNTTIKPILPKMVTLSSGSFRMGDLQGGGDSDETAHLVAIDHPFKIGMKEVTFAEYDRFCNATGRAKPRDIGWGRDQRPVVNVSWLEASAYAKWLPSVSNEKYRLPTEAEWEYAARAGTETKYWWGNQIGENKANCYDCGSQWDGKKTAPVGSFAANPWGLYDTVGNVWEWTCSEDENPYNGAENSCKNDANKAGRRVLRGGSWDYNSGDVRAAYRFRNTVGYRYNNIGFRLAQDL